LYGQKEKGIYMTAADYSNKVLTYEIGYKIKLHNSLWAAPCVTVIQLKLKKNGISGYPDAKNDAYRFYNNEEYRLAEAGGIYIYTQTQKIPQGKGINV